MKARSVDCFEGDEGLYYIESTDELFVLSEKKFEMGFRPKVGLVSYWTYTVEGYEMKEINLGLTDTDLVYIGEVE